MWGALKILAITKPLVADRLDSAQNMSEGHIIKVKNQNEFKLERSTCFFPKEIASKRSDDDSQNFQNENYTLTPKGPGCHQTLIITKHLFYPLKHRGGTQT